MKNILKYKQFENNWQIELTEDESELKDNLEFILLDLKDLKDLEEKPFISPEEMEKIRNLERYKLVLPIRNVSNN